jgi:tetratricopeptide (TPR) repeat protein
MRRMNQPLQHGKFCITIKLITIKEMSDFEQYEKIELYLKKELTQDEMKAFENDIKNNPKLAEAVELHRLEWDAMEVLIEADLKKKMTEWHVPFEATPQPKGLAGSVFSPKNDKINRALSVSSTSRNRLNWLMGIAASLTFLTVATVWYFKRTQPQKPEISTIEPTQKIDTPSVFSPILEEKKEEKIVEKPQKQDTKKVETPILKDDKNYFAYAYEAYENEVAPTYEDMQVRGGNNENILDEAGKAYDKKDFKRAIDLLKNTPATDENFAGLEILAHAYFQSKNTKSALPVFRNLLKLSGKKSKEKTEWYLLLCYVSDYKNHKMEFKALSESILAQKEHTYFEETKKLMNNMK